MRPALPRIFRTATFRFATLYVAVFAASALLLGAAVLFASRSALEEQMHARIDGELDYLQREQRLGGLDRLIALVNTRGRGASALDYLVRLPDGRHGAGEMPAINGLEPGWTKITVSEASEDGGRPERDLARVVRLDDGVLLGVGTDLVQLDDLEEAIGTALAWTIGLAAALGIGGGIWLSRAFLGRVDTIARTAEAIIAGDLTRRVPGRGTGDDLDRLAATLNRMLDRIAVLMESLRQVSSDVAHDLRTPLTRLYQRLEAARSRDGTPADTEAAIEAATAEAEGLLQTFASLLRIAQVEGASPADGFTSVDLTRLTETVCHAYRPDMEDQGYTLTVALDPGMKILGDSDLLTQALANLLENAMRHTPPGTTITVTLRKSSRGGPSLIVADNGPGVAEDEMPKLTRRFFRAEQSRTTPGSGLGLSLVHAVAELHEAHLAVTSAHPGLQVTLAFEQKSRDG